MSQLSLSYTFLCRSSGSAIQFMVGRLLVWTSFSDHLFPKLWLFPFSLSWIELNNNIIYYFAGALLGMNDNAKHLWENLGNIKLNESQFHDVLFVFPLCISLMFFLLVFCFMSRVTYIKKRISLQTCIQIYIDWMKDKKLLSSVKSYLSYESTWPII